LHLNLVFKAYIREVMLGLEKPCVEFFNPASDQKL